MLKTIKELDRRKIIRRMEANSGNETDISHPQAAAFPQGRLSAEAATQLQKQKNAKRTQFPPADMGVTTFIEKNYGKKDHPETCQKHYENAGLQTENRNSRHSAGRQPAEIRNPERIESQIRPY